jgi:hypothetical protein
MMNTYQCKNNIISKDESGVDRISFQICFYDPIEKLAELDQRGELFI